MSTTIPTTSLIAATLAAVTPLLAFAVIMIFTRRRLRLSAGLSIAAVTVSLLCACLLLVRHWGLEAPLVSTSQWVHTGLLDITVGVLLDPVSLLMLAVVAVICFLVQVYSLGYMAGDPGFARYYAFMSLFAWAMITMTISPSLLQLYIFWELVGLASYLLIGFYFEKFSASEAGKKAFVMTRLGDVAFMLGILLLLVQIGDLSILKLNAPATAAGLSPALGTLGMLLIFGGIAGKSAQFPLLTWLPDAMEGPTPVSALLHSATMVAAGVYLFARLFPLFAHFPTAMTVCLAIGTISMLLASTMALVARDIKQVWAYSTISQLGFMIMGLAAGSSFAGIFHLTTHAGFKALLFLCSGVFIHHYGTNDMFAIGRRGGRGLIVPMVCMTLAAAALAGLPPFSGFFSKEVIMGALADLDNPLWIVAGLLGAFLTAYYAFRLIFAILFPAVAGADADDAHADDGHHDHAHASHGAFAMAGPLVVLALVTLVLGFAQGPLARFLTFGHYPAPAAAHHHWLPYTAIGLALAGLILAWIEFGRRRATRIGFTERLPALAELFAQRWYIDHFYRRFLDTVIYALISRACALNDQRVIDGGIDGMGRATVRSGQGISEMHRAMVQSKLAVMFAVIFLLGIYFFV